MNTEKPSSPYLKWGCLSTIILLVVVAVSQNISCGGGKSSASKADIESYISEAQQDSAKLCTMKAERKEYTNMKEIAKEADAIYAHDMSTKHSEDSAIFNTDKHLMSLVKYNRNKCDSISSFHRVQFGRALGHELSNRAVYPIKDIAVNITGKFNNILTLYSSEFVKQGKIETNYSTYEELFDRMGFKEVRFATDKNSDFTSYEILS